ncbi:MAG: ABC transporter ATP-binding protein [Alphaproteobacteria bacterium]
MSLLEVSRLKASYGEIQALHGVDLALDESSVTTVLGANGAGKTTLLRAICGTVSRTGEISFAGERIDAAPTASIIRRGIGHVPEGRGTFVKLSVEDNLKLGAYARRDRGAAAEDMERVYGYFPVLAERRRQQAGTLSGGEQQMLAIGRALMSRPRLLVLDEPSFGLAPKIVSMIFEIMARIRDERQAALLLVEQNAALALDFADHAYLLETGRMIRAGRAADLREDAAIRRAYLGY